MKTVAIATAAAALGISAVRLRQLCQEGRVKGAEKIGRDWIVPIGKDGRPDVEPVDGPGPKLTWERKRLRSTIGP